MKIEVFSSRNVSKNNSSFSINKEENKNSLLVDQSLEKLTVDACTPNKEYKEQLWQMLVERSGNYTNEQYAAIMKGFARKSQYPLLQEYFENKFFENFPEVLSYQGESYAILFFKYLAPTFVIRDDILKSFIRLGKWIRYNDLKIKKLYEKSKII